MASIERTAYPRLKRIPTAKELREIYTPTPEEIEFSYRAARGTENRLTLLVLLKVFQRLGYFPPLDEIPSIIVSHISMSLRTEPGVAPGYAPARSTGTTRRFGSTWRLSLMGGTRDMSRRRPFFGPRRSWTTRPT